MRSERGFTLLELVLALIIGSMLVTILVSAMPTVLRIFPQVSNTLDLQHDVQTTRQWLAHDAHSAQTFEALPSPAYARFEWYDYTSAPPTHYTVTYSYNDEKHSLVRRMEKDGKLQATSEVAGHVLDEQDVQFHYSPVQRTVRVDIKVARRGEEAPSQKASFIFHLRPTAEKSHE